MSRSGYTDSGDNSCWLWRGAVKKAIEGKRGQQALREIAEALDAMPVKELAADSLVTADGQYCTLGVLGKARGIAIEELNPDDPAQVANAFNIAPALAQEIVYENDETHDFFYSRYVEICGPMRPGWPEWNNHHQMCYVDYTPQEVAQRRWCYMSQWVKSNLKDENHEQV